MKPNKIKLQQATTNQQNQAFAANNLNAQTIATKRFVAYYRVSTHKQGQSGLGLDAQKNTVEQFAGGRGSIIAEYREIESGKKNNRPELLKAIQFAKEQNATLLIAKLDRLSRDAVFVLTLHSTGVDFVACDLPDANTLTIGIFASMAQWERERICQRIKEALAVKKAQGVKLGSPKGWDKKAQAKGSKARASKAVQENANRQAYLFIKELRDTGKTWQTIADKVNSIGLKTVTGKSFQATTAMRIYNMFAEVVA